MVMNAETQQLLRVLRIMVEASALNRTFVASPLWLREHHGQVGRKNGEAGRWGRYHEMSSSRQRHCDLEPTAAVDTCTGLA